MIKLEYTKTEREKPAYITIRYLTYKVTHVPCGLQIRGHGVFLTMELPNLHQLTRDELRGLIDTAITNARNNSKRAGDYIKRTVAANNGEVFK